MDAAGLASGFKKTNGISRKHQNHNQGKAGGAQRLDEIAKSIALRRHNIC
jgi:hypothetical protein